MARPAAGCWLKRADVTIVARRRRDEWKRVLGPVEELPSDGVDYDEWVKGEGEGHTVGYKDGRTRLDVDERFDSFELESVRPGERIRWKNGDACGIAAAVVIQSNPFRR